MYTSPYRQTWSFPGGFQTHDQLQQHHFEEQKKSQVSQLSMVKQIIILKKIAQARRQAWIFFRLFSIQSSA